MNIRLHSSIADALTTGSVQPSGGSATTAGSQSGSFSSAMESAIGAVEDSSRKASQSVEAFLAGGSTDVHSVALATQRAEVTLELFQQVRNKVVSAYQEIMRSQL